MELLWKAPMNFNETVASAKVLSLLNIDILVGKSSFYIISELFRTNELFVDSVAN